MAVKRLTETGIERIKPPASGRLEVADELLTGLTLRITTNGVKSWYFIYRLGGKQHRMFLGRYPEITLRLARELVRTARQDIAFGNDPIQQRQEKIFRQIEAQEQGITIEALSKEFIERHCKPKNRRWKATEQVFRNHINPALGDAVAKDVRRRDVVAILDKLASTKRPSGANHALVALRKMYNWAIERDILEFNPCTNVKKPIPVKERERVLSRDEIRKLWHTAEEEAYPYGPVLQLLLLTGQRRSEIANLKWSYIDLEEKVIHLPAENVKANRAHDVPLSDMAIAILKSLPRFKGPYVFSTSYGAKPINGFGKAKVWIDDAFGIEDWRIHDLRRTCATGMAELGVTLPTISRVLNHAEGGVTKIYARYSFLSEKRNALNLWASHVQDIISGDKGHPSNVVRFQTR